MHSLAVLYRALQFLAHMAHHFAKGCSFFEDHKFLGKLYGTYEENFDSLTERMIGKGSVVTVADRMTLDLEATELLQELVGEDDFEDMDDWFEMLLTGEQDLCAKIEKLASGKGISQGTLNLIAGLADESEVRQYKIGQRVAVCDCDDDAADDSED